MRAGLLVVLWVVAAGMAVGVVIQAIENWRVTLILIGGAALLAVGSLAIRKWPWIGRVTDWTIAAVFTSIFTLYGLALFLAAAFVAARWIAERPGWVALVALLPWAGLLHLVIKPLTGAARRRKSATVLFNGRVPVWVTAGAYSLWIVLVSAGFFSTVAWILVRNDYAAFQAEPADIDPVYGWFLWQAFATIPVISDPEALGVIEPLGGADRLLSWLAVVHVSLVVVVILPAMLFFWSHRNEGVDPAAAAEEADPRLLPVWVWWPLEQLPRRRNRTTMV
ncbi:MAG: hypothetical protein AAGD35_08565 [Actinomycetota bacterium]